MGSKIQMEWDEGALDDMISWILYNRKTAAKIQKMIIAIAKTNNQPPLWKPERLTGTLAGMWSLRINDKDRLIYCMREGVVVIASCRGHYDDH